MQTSAQHSPPPDHQAPGPRPDPGLSPSGPDPERLARARQRVEALKGLYVHLSIFVLVLAGLTVINAATGGGWWVQWVLLGWGIGVLVHAIAVFGQRSRTVADWEERKLKEFLDRREL